MTEKEIKAVLIEDKKVNGIIYLEQLRGPNGYSAYELYVKNLPDGEIPLSEQEWVNSLSKANYYKQYKSTYIASQDGETTIPINIREYNETTILDVDINGLRLNENEYTVDDVNIILSKPINKGTEVNFVCSKTIVATANDYDLLRGTDGTDVTSATSGTPTQSDGYTVTPITFNKSDNTAVTVNVQAKNGINGEGVPDGGTTGQILAKVSDTNQDVEWINKPTIIDNLDGNSSTNAPSQNAVNQGLLSINNFIGDLFKFQSVNQQVTIGANGNVGSPIANINTPEGYTILGIFPLENGYADQWQVTYAVYQNQVFAYIKSYYAQQLTAFLKCTVIYIKSDYLS